MSMNLHLAQINIGKIVGPMESPEMADFANNLNYINGLAESSPGFVWRLKDESNNATSIKIFDDDFLIVNMSVWKSIDDLFNFAYKSEHLEFFKRRQEWFHKMTEAYMTMWYVDEHHVPDPQEGKERLMYLRKHGETPHAFTFRKRFTPEEYLNSPAPTLEK
ncbi:MAG TPA: DUF3291 domain-containing protein [Cyclobacteriaceae bacterium]|nr:DUF3291 domain-containing protein [Cyclobacteriaceae bacterium]